MADTSRKYKANILIAAVQVPYTRGGAEILVDALKKELQARDYAVDIIQLPFSSQPKEALLKQMALWRGMDLRRFNGKDIDLVITTKFPSYALSHPNKTVWLVHQHRTLYDLYGSRFGEFSTECDDEALRQMLTKADKAALSECQGIYTISQNVTDRLQRYLGMSSTPLLPPLPLGDAYHSAAKENYILSVGRLCSIKRVDMIVKAMPQIKDFVKLKVVGTVDEPEYDTYLQSEINKHHLWSRVEFLGRVDDETLLSLYANSLGVYYAPYDEDYGFVTLEGLASGKPIVTAKDSGGVLAFVKDRVNGLIVDSDETSVAAAFNSLIEDEKLYNQLCANAISARLTSTWDEVIANLTSSLNSGASPKRVVNEN